MSPANPAHANFLVLDFDPRSGLPFFREGRQRFRAEWEGKYFAEKKESLITRWRADGKELFYYGINGTMMAVPVKTGDVFEAGTPQPLFWVRAQGYLRYDVTADGQRFLINTPSGEGASALSVVLNWTAKLKR